MSLNKMLKITTRPLTVVNPIHWHIYNIGEIQDSENFCHTNKPRLSAEYFTQLSSCINVSDRLSGEMLQQDVSR